MKPNASRTTEALSTFLLEVFALKWQLLESFLILSLATAGQHLQPSMNSTAARVIIQLPQPVTQHPTIMGAMA